MPRTAKHMIESFSDKDPDKFSSEMPGLTNEELGKLIGEMKKYFKDEIPKGYTLKDLDQLSVPILSALIILHPETISKRLILLPRDKVFAIVLDLAELAVLGGMKLLHLLYHERLNKETLNGPH